MAKVTIEYSPSYDSYWATIPGGSTKQVTKEQADLLSSDPSAVETFFNSAVDAGKQILYGGSQLISELAGNEYLANNAKQQLVPIQQRQEAREMQSPTSQFLGQAAPYIAADTAAIATGGWPAAAIVGATTGAAGNPNDPLLGATVGGAFPGAMALTSPVIKAGTTMAQRLMGRAEIAAAHSDFSTMLKISSKVDDETGMLVPRGGNSAIMQGIQDAAPSLMNSTARSATNLERIMPQIRQVSGISDDVFTRPVITAAKDANDKAFKALNESSRLAPADAKALHSKIGDLTSRINNTDNLDQINKLNVGRDRLVADYVYSLPEEMQQQAMQLYQQREAINAIKSIMSRNQSSALNLDDLAGLTRSRLFKHLGPAVAKATPPGPAIPGSMRHLTSIAANTVKKNAIPTVTAAGILNLFR